MLNFLLFILFSSVIIHINIIFMYYFVQINYWSSKMSPFENGFDPFESSQILFSSHFFMITEIFLIFDVELVIIMPMIVMMSNMKTL